MIIAQKSNDCKMWLISVPGGSFPAGEAEPPRRYALWGLDRSAFPAGSLLSFFNQMNTEKVHHFHRIQ